MSGGVDSSVAAALLVAQGYEVIGLMMRLWGEPVAGDPLGEVHNRCCSPDAMAQARRVADLLDIPFYAIDAQEPFRNKIVSFFIDGYASGVTPNPCVECNRHIRWDFLLHKALGLEAAYLATGHYARVRQTEAGAWQLLQAVDAHKDQSYVLSVMGPAQLRHALFPIGGYHKAEVRALARKFNLPVAERADSQDLCFLADNDYRRFLTEHARAAIRPGPIETVEGVVIGQHQGLPFYTIGQRKGLGVAGPEPLYVVGTRPEANTLVVGPAAALGQAALTAGRVNWTSGAAPTAPFRAQVKIRYKAPPMPATITPLPEARMHVQFDQRLRDITPGQAAVVYDGEVCLGGGVILPAAPSARAA